MSTDSKTRAELADIAQQLAETHDRGDGLRVVVVVTDESGDFVGVGMNTAGDDADRILRCAVAGEDLQFHDVMGADDARYTRRGRTRPSPTVVSKVRT